MKKQFSTIMLTAATAILAITACKNSPYPGYEMSDKNVYVKYYNHEENGVKPKEGDLVRISLIVKNDKDSVLTDSRDPKYNRPGFTYYEFPLPKPEFNGSFEGGLTLLSVGDSASLLISVDTMYKDKPLPPFMKKGTMLKYDVKLLKITDKAEVEKEQKKKMEEQNVMLELRKNEEPKALAHYLEENKITVKPTESGMYFVEIKKGSGPKLKDGDSVLVNYTGTLLSGSVFDTSDKDAAKAAGVFDERRPYEPIPVKVGAHRLIPAWEEALTYMTVGSKAKLILPSKMGYGEMSTGAIPPYSPLVFEMEVVKKF
jgi:FKBP-type peptidyl-prolyl cis-trans isomerase